MYPSVRLWKHLQRDDAVSPVTNQRISQNLSRRCRPVQESQSDRMSPFDVNSLNQLDATLPSRPVAKKTNLYTVRLICSSVNLVQTASRIRLGGATSGYNSFLVQEASRWTTPENASVCRTEARRRTPKAKCSGRVLTQYKSCRADLISAKAHHRRCRRWAFSLTIMPFVADRVWFQIVSCPCRVVFRSCCKPFALWLLTRFRKSLPLP
jgi:hypothetical protein